MTVLILIVCQLLLTRQEASEMLGISIRKLDELAARGDLKPRRIDDCVRFFVGDLIQFAGQIKAESKSGENASGASDDCA